MKRLLAVLAIGFVLSSSSHALAQQPSLADRETARSLMDQGDRQRESGDLKAALKSYEAADAVMNVPTTGIEVARTQIALLQLLEARETLGRILRSPSKPNDPAPFAYARKEAEVMNNELATRIPSLQVVIENAEPGRTPELSIDHEPIPAAAAKMPRKVNPGAHTVVVKAGRVEKKLEVTVVEHEMKTVTVDLDFKEAVDAPPSPRSESSTVPAVLTYGGFGLAALGIGIGSVTGLMSISKTGDLKDVCKGDKCPPGKQGDLDSATSLGNVSTVAFIAAGVGVGAGILGLVLSGSDKRPSPFTPQHIRAVLGPSYVGMSGAF